ncbi:MAG: rRNA maturation RNase YbeY [Mariniphaga sp.]
MSILFLTEEITRPKLRYRIITKWLKVVIEKYDFRPGDLTYIFCSDAYLRNINNKFLSHDYYTDIVTFDYCSNRRISGDMFISIERVKENSIFFNVTYEDELLRVIIHGLLHLLGYKDGNDEEKKIMRHIEGECIFLYEELL